MNMPKQLEVTSDFNGFLVYKIPKDVVKVDFKIKTKWGKYTLPKIFLYKDREIQAMGEG